MGNPLTHFNTEGRARMVDVTEKAQTVRLAQARATVRMQPATLAKIRAGTMAKGDVLAVAQVAGVMGAKRTPDLIPMTHPIPLTSVDLAFSILDAAPGPDGLSTLTITATAKTKGETGVEMEAMTAVCVAALTVYDMCKAVDRGMILGEIALMTKSGGKSGAYVREATP